MTDRLDEGDEERLKSALWYSIGKAVDEETLRLGVTASPHFIGALTEMVWAHIITTSQDLASFAKHAGRTTIAVEDVMLLARRNEGLEEVLKEFRDEYRAAAGAVPRPASVSVSAARRGRGGRK